MEQEKITKSIRENRGILRQLTSLNNEIKNLKGRVGELEKTKKEIYSTGKYIPIIKDVGIPIDNMSEKEIANIKVGGTDPD